MTKICKAQKMLVNHKLCPILRMSQLASLDGIHNMPETKVASTFYRLITKSAKIYVIPREKFCQNLDYVDQRLSQKRRAEVFL